MIFFLIGTSKAGPHISHSVDPSFIFHSLLGPKSGKKNMKRVLFLKSYVSLTSLPPPPPLPQTPIIRKKPEFL